MIFIRRMDSEHNGTVVKHVCDGLDNKACEDDIRCKFCYLFIPAAVLCLIIHRWFECIPQKSETHNHGCRKREEVATFTAATCK